MTRKPWLFTILKFLFIQFSFFLFCFGGYFTRMSWFNNLTWKLETKKSGLHFKPTSSCYLSSLVTIVANMGLESMSIESMSQMYRSKNGGYRTQFNGTFRRSLQNKDRVASNPNPDRLISRSSTLLLCGFKWGFPIHGGTPTCHPFLDGIFPYKPSSIGVPPWLWKPPNTFNIL